MTDAEYSLIEFNLNHKSNIEYFNATLADLAVIFENGSFAEAQPERDQFDMGLTFKFEYRGHKIRILFEYNPFGSPYATIFRVAPPQAPYTMGGFWFYDNKAEHIKNVIEQQLGRLEKYGHVLE